MGGLGSRLKKSRENKRLTQIEVSKKLGISNGTLSGYERDYRDPDTDTLSKLAHLYDVSLDWLLTGRHDSTHQNDNSSDELTTIMYHKWDQLDERRRKQALKLIEILEQEADEENNKN